MTVCVLGLRGFPDNYTAKVSRYVSITRVMAKLGYTVLVLNRDCGKVKTAQIFENGGSVRSANSVYYDVKSYTLGKLLRRCSILFEFFCILRFFKGHKVGVMILYTCSFPAALIFFLYAKIFRAKLVLDYVEKRSQLQVRKGKLLSAINDWLFEKLAFRLMDGVFVISKFLKQEVEKSIDSDRIYKLLPVCNFDLFLDDGTEAAPQKKYVLYCGSTDYMDVINFIIESYRQAGIGDKIDLYLVLAGEFRMVDGLKQELKGDPFISVFSKLPYGQLIQRYKDALCLLIPMRPSIQDEARFPQKITEYLASGRPIISNAVGEIGLYFRHLENAILANNYLVSDYAAVLRQVAAGEIDLDGIGSRAFNLGKANFSEKALSENLNRFLLSL